MFSKSFNQSFPEVETYHNYWWKSGDRQSFPFQPPLEPLSVLLFYAGALVQIYPSAKAGVGCSNTSSSDVPAPAGYLSEDIR